MRATGISLSTSGSHPNHKNIIQLLHCKTLSDKYVVKTVARYAIQCKYYNLTNIVKLPWQHCMCAHHVV